MKRTTVLWLIIFLFLGSAQAQWKWQNPLPTGNSLRSVDFPSDSIGYIAGYFGTILKTMDAGTSWNIIRESHDQNLPTINESRLLSVDFSNVMHGAAVGAQILITNDGGNTWTEIPNVSGQTLYSVEFVNDTLGFAVGFGGAIMKTINGGQSWSMQSANNTTIQFYDVFFFNGDTGYIAGGDGTSGDWGRLYKTINGGQDWIEVTSINQSTGGFISMFFNDPLTGFVISTGSVVNKTTNGGVTWTTQGLLGGMPREIKFIDSNKGFIVGDGASIYSTTDAGANWSLSNLPFGCEFQSVEMITGDVAYAVGCQGNIYKTVDAGINWNNAKAEVTGQTLNSVWFTGPETGYSVGNNSVVLKTTDAGEHWAVQSTPVSATTFNAVFFKSADTGFIGGASGKLLMTTNGGNTWSIVNTGTTAGWSAIHFPTSQTGYVAGSLSSTGRILKTSDGGASWTSYTNTARIQYGVCFTSPDTGYTCGSATTLNAGIMKTTNGGVTWTKTTILAASILYTIVFPAVDTGYCAGNGGVILKTTDGGITWSQLNQSYITGIIKSLFFFNSVHGYAISGNKLIKTMDGGLTWTLETILQEISGQPRIFFTNDSTGWAVSNLAYILHKGTPALPAAFDLTGGGNYCESGNGIPVGLSGSSTGVTYTLFKNGIAQVPVVAGTGFAISFGNQTIGTYTVSGTNASGTTPMNGSAVVSLLPEIPVSVSISPNVNPVPEETMVILTATPVNGGTSPSYQWLVNGIAAGSDSPVFQYQPADNDAVVCILTSSELCTSGNPATSNTVVIRVIADTLSLNGIVVAEGDTNCYNALNEIIVAGNGTTFTVQAGGSATMIAGERIVYMPGTMVDSGGYLHGYISTVFCTNPVNPVVGNTQGSGDVAVFFKNSLEDRSIRVYPNPTTGDFTLDLSRFTGDKSTDVTIFNMMGKRIMTTITKGEMKLNFNLSHVPQGIYMIKVLRGAMVETIKLVKQ